MKKFNQFINENNGSPQVSNFENITLFLINQNKEAFDISTLEYDLSEKDHRFGTLTSYVKCKELSEKVNVGLEDYENVLNDRISFINDFSIIIEKFYTEYNYMPLVNIMEKRDGIYITFSSSVEELTMDKKVFAYLSSDKIVNKYNL